MKKKWVSPMAAAKRILFSLYCSRKPREATEWLNEKLETARIADEKVAHKGESNV